MSYVWNLPTKVLFGPGRVKKLHKEKMPGKKALLVLSNGRSAKENGTLDTVSEELRTAGAEIVLYDRIESNPLDTTIMAGVEEARRSGCDFIVGLGGGSVLDAATVIASVAPQPDGSVWDYISGGTGGGRRLEKPALPLIEITTSAGTGSEVDRWGVVSNAETEEKIGFRGSFARLAIVDPELMLTVPPRFTAFQGFDALFHSVEGFIAVTCNEAAAMVQREAIRNVARYLPRAVADGSDLEARTGMALANTLSGYSMELGSCTSEHAIEHAMSAVHHELPYGAGLIMISLAYFNWFIEHGACPDRFIEMAQLMGRTDAATPGDFTAALRELQGACGVDDLHMSEYGIKKEEAEMLAEKARTTMGGLFQCDPIELPPQGVVEILRASYR
ncbi:MAG: iron-containing alcohol dehydrogenase [Anaerovoracaceae bacterium]|jgi:alcohol dehydrogenase